MPKLVIYYDLSENDLKLMEELTSTLSKDDITTFVDMNNKETKCKNLRIIGNKVFGDLVE